MRRRRLSEPWAAERVELREAEQAVHVFVEAGLPAPAFQQESGLFKQIFTRRLTTEVTTEVTGEVTPVLRLLGELHGTMSRGDLKEVLELKNAEHFRKTYLVPALEAGLIEMTIPDRPKSRLQKYRLTSAGRAKLADAGSTAEGVLGRRG